MGTGRAMSGKTAKRRRNGKAADRTVGNHRGRFVVMAAMLSLGSVTGASALDVRPPDRPDFEKGERAATRIARGFEAFAPRRVRVVGIVPPFAADAADRLMREADPLAAILSTRLAR